MELVIEVIYCGENNSCCCDCYVDLSLYVRIPFGSLVFINMKRISIAPSWHSYVMNSIRLEIISNRYCFIFFGEVDIIQSLYYDYEDDIYDDNLDSYN